MRVQYCFVTYPIHCCWVQHIRKYDTFFIANTGENFLSVVEYVAFSSVWWNSKGYVVLKITGDEGERRLVGQRCEFSFLFPLSEHC